MSEWTCPSCGKMALVSRHEGEQFVYCPACEYFDNVANYNPLASRRGEVEPADAPPLGSPPRPTCGTCPYFDDRLGFGVKDGRCCVRSVPNPIGRNRDDWCGEHPDFPSYLDSRRAWLTGRTDDAA
jgi:ribosomal protein S27AE